MNNCLILLTNYFPFHKGEEYLESEIQYLSKKFSHIYLISTMVSGDMKQTRTVPGNVTVLPVGIKHNIKGKLKMVFRQFNTIIKDKEKVKMISNDSKGNILYKIYCYYFECRAMEIYERIDDMLDEFDYKQYDSLVIYSYWLYITARVGVELKNIYFKGNTPYTFSRAHGYDINEHANPLKYLPQREFLLDNLDNIFPVSQNGVDFLKERYPICKHKVDVRRLGTNKININKKNNNDELRIVSCSTVRKLKRIDLLIDALVVLRAKSVDFKWTHIGGGPEFENIKKYAMEKLDDSQFEFTGHVKNSEVLNWYQKNQATVFVNTSLSEGVPVSIMEAMSMSLPIIATDVGGTKEIIDPDVTGILLKRDCTKEEIAKSLMKIHRMSRKEYQQMCQDSYKLWESCCSAESLYNQFACEISSFNNTRFSLNN